MVVDFLCLFLAVPWVSLKCVNLVIPGYNHLLVLNMCSHFFKIIISFIYLLKDDIGDDCNKQ